jgi:hypothetical protein
MKKYPDFFSVVIGPAPGLFLGFIVVAFVCACALVAWDVSRRDVSSERTPPDFHVRFWLADNLFRFLGNLLFIPIAIRGCYAYVPPVGMLFVSMGIGFGIDGLGMVAKEFGLLTTGKLAEKIKNALNSK